jgi:hypothetical protein
VAGKVAAIHGKIICAGKQILSTTLQTYLWLKALSLIFK